MTGFTATVVTKKGDLSVVDFFHAESTDMYTLQFTGDLVDRYPDFGKVIREAINQLAEHRADEATQ